MSLAVFAEKIVHGRLHPLILFPVRLILLPLSLCYALLTAVRNICYDLRILKPRTLPVPVISVGNITVGGTGKTPAAILIAEHFLERGDRVALLARNYGADSGLNDECAMIRKRFPDIIVIGEPDRTAGGHKAVEQGADIIILDDGFQHRQLNRDCDILTVDERTASGLHLPLPAGPFREIWAYRKRADIFILTKCRSESVPRSLQSRTDNPLFRSVHEATGLSGIMEQRQPDYLGEKRVFLFCGIGDPAYFMETASACGAVIAGHRFFPDHYRYTEKDLAGMIIQAEACGAEILLTTEKDMVKAEPLMKNSKNNIEFLSLSITIRILENEAALWNRIHECIAQ